MPPPPSYFFICEVFVFSIIVLINVVPDHSDAVIFSCPNFKVEMCLAEKMPVFR